jgi:hypothetical protein
VTGRTNLLDGDQEGIAIAVELDATNELSVATGIPLAPQLGT